MTGTHRRIADNLASVRARIEAAAVRSGRTADQITLVAATKYTPLEQVAELIAAGCLDLGESRPQQLWDRAAALADRGIRWHLIGHLQRNKIRRTLPLVYLVHSVDSLRLAEALDAEAAALGSPVDVLLEINISGDATKTGLAPAELEPILVRTLELTHLNVRGLMGMAGREGDDNAARHDFENLRQLRDRLAARYAPDAPLADLSMGMSGDFEIAVEQGATIVRLGSILFEDLKP